MARLKGEDTFILQIGAMDGKTFDPVYEYVTQHNWPGLMIEPVAEHFIQLQKNYENYPKVRCVNVAIAEHEGLQTLYRIPSQHIKDAQVPKWGLGASSFYKDRNALAFKEVEPYVIEEEVTCNTLANTIKSYDITSIDILQIDTEGYDFHILKQVDFTRFKPAIINMEIINLPKTERNAVHALLDQHHYLYTKAGYDLLAIHIPTLAKF
jgi:FkbM family methyltransferase